MAKKRRLHGASHPSSSKVKVEGRGDDVMLARDRLKGALHDLVHSDEESSSSQEESVSTVTKQVQIKKEVKPPLIRRRKRKSPMELELAFHHTFVMKMFDRSVDLAQFKEDTPLYPICRAWIANQPRVPLPYPSLENSGIKAEADGLFDLNKDDVIKDVYYMPAPSGPPWTNRMPPVEPPTLKGFTLDYNSENLPRTEELLKQHISRWGNVRRQWIEAAQANETRFQNGGKLLLNMYKRAQNAFGM